MTGGEPIVATPAGQLTGVPRPAGALFLSVPYAAPPTGSLRFAAPEAARPWSGVRDAAAPGATPPVADRRAIGRLDMTPLFGPGWLPGEDYLTVNVWAPARPASGCPVLVFVPGGGFISGSSHAPVLGGDGFLRDGIVLVTVNYRLGVHGWAHLPGAPDNRGMLDVLAALQWVQNSIAAFGGDPGNVTLAGQSAGAMLVAAALASPLSTGLFHRVVSQSGHAGVAFLPDQFQRVTSALSAASGRPATAAGLADLSDAQVVALAGEVGAVDMTLPGRPSMRTSPFGPVVDPASLPAQPVELIADRRGTPADLLVGSNTDEANLYLIPTDRGPRATPADIAAAAARLQVPVDALTARYRANRPGLSDQQLLQQITTDGMFGDGTRQLTEAHAADKRGRTFSYEFAWASNAFDGQLGACHCLELPFVFETLDLPSLNGPQALLGTSPPADLGRRVHGAWARFVRTGDPGWSQHTPDSPVRHQIS